MKPSCATMPDATYISPSKGRSSILDVMEAVSWVLCCSVYFTWYNPVGEFGKMRGVNDSFLQKIDNDFAWMDELIPYVPEFIFPYVAVYVLPLAYILSLYADKGFDLGRVRRFFITQMILITVAFIIFVAFPVRSDYLYNKQTGKHDYREDKWAGKLCYQFVHQGISLYVAFPSMHTAHAFSIAAAFSYDNLKGKTIAQLLAVVTLLSTCFTKAHGPPHLFLGLLLAYAGQTAVFEPLTRRLPMLQKSSPSWMRFYATAAAPVAFILAGEQLHRISGWATDVPAMFGFEANPVLGFYGFHP